MLGFEMISMLVYFVYQISTNEYCWSVFSLGAV